MSKRGLKAVLWGWLLSAGVVSAAELPVLWTGTRALTAPPVALSDGGVAVCFESDAGPGVARLSKSGALVWEVALEGRCVTPPVVDDSAVYARVSGVGVVALGLRAGGPMWTQRPSEKFAREDGMPWWDKGRWYTFERAGDVLLAAERLELYALSPETGEVLWQNGAYNIGESFGVSWPKGDLAIVKAGSPSPFSSTVGSSTWGDGNVYALQPSSEKVNRVVVNADVSAAVGATSVTFASAPVVVGGEDVYVLVQRFGAVKKAEIRHTPEGQAIGGSQEPARPSGVSLVRLTKSGVDVVADVTTGTHRTLTVGQMTHPTTVLGHAGTSLVFSTTDDNEGESITLQALQATDGTLQWHKDGLIHLASDGSHIAAARRTGDDAGELVVLTAEGDEVGRHPLTFDPMKLMAPVSMGGGVVYFMTPERKVVALGL